LLRVEEQGMKVAKTISIDLELLQNVLRKEKNFSKAIAEALEMWLAKKLESEVWTVKEDSEKTPVDEKR